MNVEIRVPYHADQLVPRVKTEYGFEGQIRGSFFEFVLQGAVARGSCRGTLTA